MVDNVSNIEVLDYSVNFISKHVGGNFFTLSERLIDNIACNSNLIIISGFFIAQNDNVSDLQAYVFVINE